MDTQKPQRLPTRLEPPGCRTAHSSGPHPRRLMPAAACRLLRPGILIPLSTVNGFWNQLAMGYTITT